MGLGSGQQRWRQVGDRRYVNVINRFETMALVVEFSELAFCCRIVIFFFLKFYHFLFNVILIQALQTKTIPS